MNTLMLIIMTLNLTVSKENNIYKKIESLSGKIENEVIDRFGVLAMSAKNMFDLSRLRFIYNMSFVTKIDINKNSVVFSFNKNKSVLFKKYFDCLVENLRLASIGHSFKRGNHGSLCVEVPIGFGVVPIEAAFMCADYFIYNKKNV